MGYVHKGTNRLHFSYPHKTNKYKLQRATKCSIVLAHSHNVLYTKKQPSIAYSTGAKIAIISSLNQSKSLANFSVIVGFGGTALRHKGKVNSAPRHKCCTAFRLFHGPGSATCTVICALAHRYSTTAVLPSFPLCSVRRLIPFLRFRRMYILSIASTHNPSLSSHVHPVNRIKVNLRLCRSWNPERKTVLDFFVFGVVCKTGFVLLEAQQHALQKVVVAQVAVASFVVDVLPFLLLSKNEFLQARTNHNKRALNK